MIDLEMLIERIEPPELQDFAREILDDATEEVEITLAVMQEAKQVSIEERLEVVEQNSTVVDFLCRILKHILKKRLDYDLDCAKIKSEIRKKIWGIFCKLEDGKGEPVEKWEEVFDKDGIVILDVKQQQMDEVLQGMAGSFPHTIKGIKLIISIAAGITMRKIEENFYAQLDVN